MPASAPRLRHVRPGKPRVIDRDVRPRLVQLNRRLSVRPGRDPVKGKLDAGHLAVIGVVDLDGNGACAGLGPPYKAHEKAGFVEMQVDGTLAGVGAAYDLDLA